MLNSLNDFDVKIASSHHGIERERGPSCRYPWDRKHCGSSWQASHVHLTWWVPRLEKMIQMIQHMVWPGMACTPWFRDRILCCKCLAAPEVFTCHLWIHQGASDIATRHNKASCPWQEWLHCVVELRCLCRFWLYFRPRTQGEMRMPFNICLWFSMVIIWI